MLIDSGASISLIPLNTYKLVRDSRIPEYPARVLLKAASGHNLTPLAEVILPISVGNVNTFHKFIVVEEITTECVIVYDFLVTHKCILDLSKPKLELHVSKENISFECFDECQAFGTNCNETIADISTAPEALSPEAIAYQPETHKMKKAQVKSECQGECHGNSTQKKQKLKTPKIDSNLLGKVRLIDDLYIPAKSELVIEAEVSELSTDSNYLIVEGKYLRPKTPILIANTVSKNQSKIPVRLINLHDEPAKLKKKLVIASVEPCDVEYVTSNFVNSTTKK